MSNVNTTLTDLKNINIKKYYILLLDGVIVINIYSSNTLMIINNVADVDNIKCFHVWRAEECWNEEEPSRQSRHIVTTSSSFVMWWTLL